MNDASMDRRTWLASAAMALGLLLSYGTLAVQGMMYLLPQQIGRRGRKLFAGRLVDYRVGGVRTFLDLEGNDILVKRDDNGLKAFSSVCPHLGCRVHWVDAEKHFFCPCHRGVFDETGIAISGPPADGGQRLSEVPLDVDKDGGVVYIEVKDIKRS